MSDWAVRLSDALCRTARLAPSRAPPPVLAALRASMASCRVAPSAPKENDKATPASAAMADFLKIMLLPGYVDWRAPPAIRFIILRGVHPRIRVPCFMEDAPRVFRP